MVAPAPSHTSNTSTEPSRTPRTRLAKSLLRPGLHTDAWRKETQSALRVLSELHVWGSKFPWGLQHTATRSRGPSGQVWGAAHCPPSPVSDKNCIPPPPMGPTVSFPSESGAQRGSG